MKKRLYKKYSGKRKRKVQDLLHKLTKDLSEIVKDKTVLMENLKKIRKSINRKHKAFNKYSGKVQRVSMHSKRLKGRLNSWNFRKFQSLLDYKHKMNGFDVEYLDPHNTSSVCTRCGGKIAPMEKECSKCGLDRDINACVNLLKMWGGSGSPESLSMSVMKLGCQGLKADEVNQAELRGEVGRFTNR